MSDELIFEEPTSVNGRGELRAWLDALRSHPNQWAKYPVGAANGKMGTKAHHIKRGTGYGARPGEFEAASRTDSDSGLTFIFARYVGAAVES